MRWDGETCHNDKLYISMDNDLFAHRKQCFFFCVYVERQTFRWFVNELHRIANGHLITIVYLPHKQIECNESTNRTKGEKKTKNQISSNAIAEELSILILAQYQWSGGFKKKNVKHFSYVTCKNWKVKTQNQIMRLMACQYIYKKKEGRDAKKRQMETEKNMKQPCIKTKSNRLPIANYLKIFIRLIGKFTLFCFFSFCR